MSKTTKAIIITVTLVIILALTAAGGYVLSRTRPAVTDYALAPSLLNPDFEGGFRAVDGVGELGVGEGWFPWFLEAPGVHRPEYKEETRGTGSGRVYLGDSAQKQFTTFSAQDGGIRQSVTIEAGQWYEFSAWVYVWSSSESNPDTSIGGKCSAMVGINPWGSWDALHRTTVWGKEQRDVYNQWVEVTVTAQAWGDEISLFTRTQCEWPVKHNDSYWDAASFSAVEWGDCPDCPTPEPCPTAQPCAPCPTPGGCDCNCVSEADLRRVLGELHWGVVE